ncbi:MAG: hypothetical protein IPM47_18905 [Sphingobacteriales bacterium]|nr:MAG: hypothetical protein IPM47_18905 [Sphingobacteriales bacterium]
MNENTIYAIVDVETTGGSAKTDRIIEIAIYRFDGNRIVDSFTSLVNPGILIPPFITKLTGINNDMVADAPAFEDLAERVNQITREAVFVAHNVDFDYAYVRMEFKKLGHVFERRKLCTVKLARRIIPGFTSYSLGKLCSELGITIENRHRAAGDALATTELFKLLIQSDLGGHIHHDLDKTNLYKMLPPGLPPETIDHLPEETGVFYFHDQNGKVIFIDKSSDIKRRIIHYLNPNNSPRGKKSKLVQNTRHISFEETGSDLIAELMKLAEIARLKPAYNREAASKKLTFGIYKNLDSNGYYKLNLAPVNSKVMPVLAFQKEDHAYKSLAKLVNEHQLCSQLCGLEGKSTVQGTPCVNYTLQVCKGACIGLETPENYNRRLNQAIKTLDLPAPNFFIIGEGRKNGEKSAIQIEKRRLVGYGYYEPDFANTIEDLKNCIQPYTLNFSNDAVKIIKSGIKNDHLLKIVKY